MTTQDQSTPVGTDHTEPRTGYRPELDERTDRYGQYGMVREATRDQRNPRDPVAQPAVDEVKNEDGSQAPNDPFEAEFLSRQASTRDTLSDPDGTESGHEPGDASKEPDDEPQAPGGYQSPEEQRRLLGEDVERANTPADR